MPGTGIRSRKNQLRPQSGEEIYDVVAPRLIRHRVAWRWDSVSRIFLPCLELAAIVIPQQEAREYNNRHDHIRVTGLRDGTKHTRALRPTKTNRGTNSWEGNLVNAPQCWTRWCWQDQFSTLWSNFSNLLPLQTTLITKCTNSDHVDDKITFAFFQSNLLNYGWVSYCLMTVSVAAWWIKSLQLTKGRTTESSREGHNDFLGTCSFWSGSNHLTRVLWKIVKRSWELCLSFEIDKDKSWDKFMRNGSGKCTSVLNTMVLTRPVLHSVIKFLQSFTSADCSNHKMHKFKSRGHSGTLK